MPRFVNVDRLITKLETLDPTPPQLGAARLVQKIYKVDPLVCPKCFG
jgi:hypothetical protein